MSFKEFAWTGSTVIKYLSSFLKSGKLHCDRQRHGNGKKQWVNEVG